MLYLTKPLLKLYQRTGSTLAHVPGRPSHPDLFKPYIGHIEIKAHDLVGQKAFYHNVMGMRLESETQARVIFGQGAGKPWLILEPECDYLQTLRKRYNRIMFFGMYFCSKISETV